MKTNSSISGKTIESRLLKLLGTAEVKRKAVVPEELPADPEAMNERRAEWADAALQAFQIRTGTDEEDAVADLLADLMHWCDRHGQDFEQELRRAGRHHTEETVDCDTRRCRKIRDRDAAEMGVQR